MNNLSKYLDDGLGFILRSYVLFKIFAYVIQCACLSHRIITFVIFIIYFLYQKVITEHKHLSLKEFNNVIDRASHILFIILLFEIFKLRMHTVEIIFVFGVIIFGYLARRSRTRT